MQKCSDGLRRLKGWGERSFKKKRTKRKILSNGQGGHYFNIYSIGIHPRYDQDQSTSTDHLRLKFIGQTIQYR